MRHKDITRSLLHGCHSHYRLNGCRGLTLTGLWPDKDQTAHLTEGSQFVAYFYLSTERMQV